MKLATFFEKFDQFTSTPDAVAKMRVLVLRWAVQGRLVPQDFTDEPAEESFPKLAAAGVSSEEDGFPAHWLRVPLGKIGEWRGGGTPSKSRPDFWKGDLPWVSPKDMKMLHIADAQDHISPAAVEGSSVRLIPPGSLLMVVRGMILARAFPVALTTREVTINQDMKAVLPLEPRTKDFLLIALRAFEPEVLAAIEHSSHGTCKLRTEFLRDFVMPIPPLAEQQRIVAKVDELMALCDRLEAQQRERETRHAVLAHASLGRFADAPTPANLPFLFHPSFAIPPADLRKSILTLAVQGKLVPQDPNDESALALMDQITAHKAALAKAGKLRRSTTVKPMADDEAEFELPSNWSWVRFGDIMVNRDGERIPVSKEERETKAKTYDYYGASGVIDRIDGYLFDTPLLLIGEDGANLINRSTPIAFIARGQYWVNNHAHVLDGISEDFLRFIELHINAINLEKYVTGSAQPKMNQAKMNSIPIALPPLAEQRRIVAKVEQLMALVDELETQLATARTTGAGLMEAVVAELTAKA